MNTTIDSGKECVGMAGVRALTDAASISRSDLSLAEQHAAHEQMSLADAVVALGLVREKDSYTRLAEAGGFEIADLERTVSSERYFGVTTLNTTIRAPRAVVPAGGPAR